MKKMITFIGIVLILSLFPLNIYAQEGENTQNRIQNRCEVVTSRVDIITTRYNQNKERHISRYQKIATTVQNLIAKLEDKGIDTSELKKDLATFVNMKSEFVRSYVDFIENLETSKTHACGNSQGQFANEITNARRNLLSTREKSLEIKLFIINELRPDIESIRDQINNL
jgi:methionine synthase II (cobalamin-independent)